MTESSQTAGYQRWSLLTFLHWRVDAESIQRLLPGNLEVDTFDGSAWLGVIPFSMERVRPWWAPPVPWISWFLETNVRTYVRTRDGKSGVWFFSLDANQPVAVEIATRFWNLPYKHATMDLQVSSNTDSTQKRLDYSGQRHQHPDLSWAISASIDSANAATAAAGTLEEFLVERYTLFCQDRREQLYSGQVHHTPYQLCPVNHVTCTQTLTKPVIPQLDQHRPPDHAAVSLGVDVRVSPLRRVRL